MSSLRSGWMFSLQVLMAGLVLLSSQANGQVQGVRWRNHLDAAKIEAAQSGRLVLLHFWSTSCGPCKMLDRTVFSLPQVGAAIEREYVPVKVDVAVSPALARQFRIDRVPTDVILTSRGSHVSTLPSSPTADAYLTGLGNLAINYSKQSSSQITMQTGMVPIANLNSAYAQLTNSNASRAISTSPTVPANAMPRSYRNQHLAVQQPSAKIVDGNQNRTVPSGTASKVESANGQATQASGPSVATAEAPLPRAHVVQAPASGSIPVASIPGAIARGTSTPRDSLVGAAPNSLQLPPGSPPLGFEGYCPVSLKFDKTRWIPGDVQFGVIHRGRTYLCAGEQQRQQFLANPDAYSPVFSGMDPVMLLDNDHSVGGKRKYGYEYRGAFYLFSSEETMLKFKDRPDHYAASVRQAMNRLDGQATSIRR